MDQLERFHSEIGAGTQQRLLELLGNNVSPQSAALACGIDPSYVSQLLAQEEFAQQVIQLRFDRLQAASALDKKYEELEDILVDKLRDCLVYMTDPLKLLAAIRVINATKRRGAGIQAAQVQNNIVTINMPTKIIQQYVVNEKNQVTQVGDKSLVTIGSGVLLDRVQGPLNEQLKIQERVGKLLDSCADRV